MVKSSKQWVLWHVNIRILDKTTVGKACRGVLSETILQTLLQITWDRKYYEKMLLAEFGIRPKAQEGKTIPALGIPSSRT